MLNIRGLRAILEGRLLAPVTRMGLAPLLYALNIGGATEDVTIGSFVQPTPLTGGLAGLTAGGLCAKTLMFAVAVIREEELIAIKTFASF